jgi:hypothetical protein
LLKPLKVSWFNLPKTNTKNLGLQTLRRTSKNTSKRQMKKTKKLQWGPSNRVEGQLPFKYSAPSCHSETGEPYKQQQRGDKPGNDRELEYSSAQSTKKKSKKAAEATMLTSKKMEAHTMEKCRGKAVQPRIPGNKFYTYTSPSSPLHGKLGPTTHPSPFFVRPATSPSFSS